MIGLEVNGGVAVVRLDRPPVNALDQGMLDDLRWAIGQMEAQRSVRAVVFQGANGRFCAGADIAMLSDGATSQGGRAVLLNFIEALQGLYARIEALPVPTIAAMAGATTGGGLELALSCDLRVTGADVPIGLPEVAIGLLPAAGGTQRLTRYAGEAVAKRLILTGELVRGEEAAALGLVQWVVPTDEVDARALALAGGMAQRGSAVLSAGKRCIALAGGAGGYGAEIDETRRLLQLDETRGLLAAFLSC